MRNRISLIVLGVLLLTLPLWAVDGPLTNALNLRVKTDQNGYLLTTAAIYSGTDGPYTNFGNVRLRTDANGYLLVAGTGLTGAIGGSSAVGDLIYGAGGTSFTRLADVAVNQVLVSGGVGVAPAWSASPTVTGITATGNVIGTTGVYAGGSAKGGFLSPTDGLEQLVSNAGGGLEFNSGVPTLGTCTGGSMTSGSHNGAGEVTGNTSGSCIINFGAPNFTNAPFCALNDESALIAVQISARSNASITVTGAASGNNFQWICIGRIGT